MCSERLYPCVECCFFSSQLGGWSIFGNWTPLDFNQTRSLLMSQYGHFPFFRAYLKPLPTPPYLPVIQVRDVLAKMQGCLKFVLRPKKCAIQESNLTLLLLWFSHYVLSDSWRPHGLQHAKLPCPSPSLGACSNSCVSEPVIAWYDNGYIWSLSLLGYWDIVWSVLHIFYGMEFTTYFK